MRGLARAGWLVMLMACLACSAPAREQPDAAALELPPLEGSEPAVREKIETLHAELQARPDSTAAWARYAFALHAHRFEEAARAAYLEAAERAERDGVDPFLYRYLAGKAVLRSSPRDAVPDLERATALRGDDLPARLGLAQAYERTGRAADARRQYAHALSLGDNPWARFGLGRLALAAGEIDEALAELERAAAQAPQEPGIHALLAQAYARAGRRREAHRAAELGRAAGQPFDYADPWMRQVLEASVSVRSALERAIAEFQHERFAAALASVDRALEQAPEHAGARYIRGTILGRTGRCAEALGDFERAMATDPDHLGARTRAAQCLAELGRPEEARAVLAEVLARDPEHAEARALLRRLG